MNRRACWVLVVILLVAALLRFVGLGGLALIGDESYYWLWSQRLDWAYYDHPAGIALLIRTSTVLGGSSEWGVRWLNAFLGIGCVWLTYQLGRRMLSSRAGLLAAALVAVGAPYLITSRLAYTNALHLFLMLLNLLAFRRLAQENEPRLGTVGWFGGSLALLLNTKYSAYFYVLALGVAILLDHRRLLAQRSFWFGVLIGALGLAPVVWWNAAHSWASFRFQLSHMVTNVAATYSLLGNAHHALVYLTWPLVAVALTGLGRVKSPGQRLLSLVALFSLAPVALSAANSPRNLCDGLVPLLLLAGDRLPESLAGWRRRVAALALGGLALIVALYGVGTLIGLSRPSSCPRSSVVPAILKEAAGWRELGPYLAEFADPIFALDYSIAAQVNYYAGRPAYTSAGQYRFWGAPDLGNSVILSKEYLPEELVSVRLGEAFEYVEGPQRLIYAERGTTSEVRLWRAQGLRWDQETFLQRFDFLTLLAESRRR